MPIASAGGMRLLAACLLIPAALSLSGCAEAPARLPANLEPITTAPPEVVMLPTLTPKPGGEPLQVAGAEATPTGPAEAEIIPIPLTGPAAQRSAQMSGMAWYGETLILLPQYPTFTQDGQSALYALPKAEILAYLNGEVAGPLEPRPVAFYDWGVADSLPGFEGYESIAFGNDRVYVTTEVNNGFETAAWIIAGSVNPDDASITLDAATMSYIAPQTGLSNHSDEALIVVPDGTLLTLYEINGAAWNPAPVAHRFDAWLQPLEPFAFPSTEYRITDATPPDAEGRFWAINYFFPGDEELAAADPLAEQYGEGATHQSQVQVERLVEYAFGEGQIVRTERAPLQLKLTLISRNWEGIVRLEERGGFLLITDQVPETVLGFVAVP